MSTPIRLGTRRSPLAVAQSTLVADALRAASSTPVELVYVTTTGDTSTDPLRQIGGTGVFVSALRDALLSGEVDVAVHSLKDLPTAPAPGLVLAAHPPREDPRDALVARDGHTLTSLPSGARVGTGSPRRAAQLAALRPDLEVVDIRGNVDTRIGLVTDGSVDAVVLAVAGLRRLGRMQSVTEVIDSSLMTPAPGQGALAVETAASSDADGSTLLTALRSLDDPATRAAVTAERALLSALEAGCSAPVGALAVVDEPGFHTPELTLHAFVGSSDGLNEQRLSITAPLTDADAAGRQLAARLLDAGAAAFLGEPAL
ncbi:MAG: hydroxymethylbilane synthase [Actinomycetes bacterium]